MPGILSPAPANSAPVQAGGRRRTGASVKTLKKVLKKAGLKVSGKKATLTRRAKKARLMGGADEALETDEKNPPVADADGGRRRRRR